MAKAQTEDILAEDERRSDESKATMPMSLAALSDAEFASVGRKATVKMDIMIMPCLVIMYIMNYLDRQNIAAAKLADIDKDLRLSDVQYQTCISLLFVGYSKSASRWVASSIFQLTSPNSPHAGSLQHHCRESQVPRHLHLRGYGCLGHDLRLHGRSPKLYWSRARSILHWIHRGRILSWCTYYMSLFYSRKQYAFRVAVLYSGSQLGNAFGGLFAIGILKLDGKHGLQGWRWVSDPSNVFQRQPTNSAPSTALFD